jgi:cytochrome o ubiquinol oxidase subunit IV
MTDEFDAIEPHSKNGTLTSYIIGFLLSLVLTLAAYFLVEKQWFDRWTLILVITALAIVQMIVQLFFFLHLGNESKPRWNLHSFLFMALVVVVLAGGSLWIMYSLDVRVMPAANINSEMPHD